MIKFEGWYIVPGEIVLTAEEYLKFKRRYNNLSDETKKLIAKQQATIIGGPNEKNQPGEK